MSSNRENTRIINGTPVVDITIGDEIDPQIFSECPLCNRMDLVLYFEICKHTMCYNCMRKEAAIKYASEFEDYPEGETIDDFDSDDESIVDNFDLFTWYKRRLIKSYAYCGKILNSGAMCVNCHPIVKLDSDE